MRLTKAKRVKADPTLSPARVRGRVRAHHSVDLETSTLQ